MEGKFDGGLLLSALIFRRGGDATLNLTKLFQDVVYTGNTLETITERCSVVKYQVIRISTLRLMDIALIQVMILGSSMQYNIKPGYILLLFPFYILSTMPRKVKTQRKRFVTCIALFFLAFHQSEMYNFSLLPLKQ